MADRDPWLEMRQATRARIGLGRAGDALPTRALLDFQLAHARARDAVHAVVDFDAVQLALSPLTIHRVRSAAPDRDAYLRRPDLGRRLSDDGRAQLLSAADDAEWDLVFVIADGLSASAVSTHAAPLMLAILGRLQGWRIAPIVCVEQGRVAVGDEIGEIIRAQLCAVLIGERPGLSAADSLGLYLTWSPRVGRRDSERNCISNIHAEGLSYAQAATTAAWLIQEATRRRLTGVDLKDEVAAGLPMEREPKAVD